MATWTDRQEAARIEANRQVRYLAVHVAPIPPDEPTYPRVFENTLIAFLIFGAFYLVCSVTVSILREAGVLLGEPDAALAYEILQVLLDGRDVTRLAQARRVKRGIARTFQINQLFRGLSVLENVYMAVAERVGAAPSMLTPRKVCGWPAGLMALMATWSPPSVPFLKPMAEDKPEAS